MGARAERLGEELASRWQRMIDAKRLLADCQALVRELEADLRGQLDARSDLQALLTREHHGATVAKRTRRSAEDWTAERVTQAAVAWALGCVFVRFLEDNALVDTPRLSGTGIRLQRARDEEIHYFQLHPERTAREYLEDTFRSVAALPGCSGLFDDRHNPLWQLPISGDGARDLLEHWRMIDPQSGALVHDFGDKAWGTRFLGDLYQDLSESARKQYALLQTPEFVEEFILERTLEPAIDEFGLRAVTLIDPACGSGHFLLGAFNRLIRHWREREPGAEAREHVERVLAAIAGVDLNPFAAAIARFRLLIAAVRASGATGLKDAPDFRLAIAVGDSLLHTPRSDRLDVGRADIRKGIEHVFRTEDADDLRRILGRQYHVVVANPPYITPKDPALRQAYRDRYPSCSGKYSLTVPFMEVLFDLAISTAHSHGGAGHVGQITGQAFMKREFGKTLVETFLASIDLTLIVDTSGAHIPGHGTPTMILVGRNRAPVGPTIRVVQGVRGEPTAPADPALGLVWTAILRQVDDPGSQSQFVSVQDVNRSDLRRHPWSLGGGGASDLRLMLERGRQSVQTTVDSIGIMSFTLEDEMYLVDPRVVRRKDLSESVRPFLGGDDLRDWTSLSPNLVIFPYRDDLRPVDKLSEAVARHLWVGRTNLANSIMFGGRTKVESGLQWFEFGRLTANKLRSPLTIGFAEVATHNHFVLKRDGSVFKNTAQVVKLSDSAGLEDYLALLGALNSSTACFFLKQVSHTKGGGGVNEGFRGDLWEFFFQFNGAKIGQLPLPEELPVDLPQELDGLAQRLASCTPWAVEPTLENLSRARELTEATRGRLIGLQEELDWEIYRRYRLVDKKLTAHGSDDVPSLRFGQRAFEIVLARRVAAGEEETTWFERHGSTPTTEIPASWPEPYQELVRRRIELIESNRDIGLIERPEYKRRWQWEPWEKQQQRALREWLLNRLEDERYWRLPQLTSCARLADEVRKDAQFRSVAELYVGRADVDLAKLVETLVIEEAVPYLAAWRYTAEGVRVRAAWERTWELQRHEDAIDALCALPEADPHRLTSEQAEARKQLEVGQIPVPPKYTSKHFRKGRYWQLRGKLDVPKERFIFYPGCERAADPSAVVGWAGWNHLERSQALAQYVTRMRQEERWEADRLTPLLAGLAEQLPWVMQWHNEFDPSLGRRVGDAYSDFLSGQLAELGLSPEDLAAWRPPEATRGRRARKVAV
jgi:hypothetical protein